MFRNAMPSSSSRLMLLLAVASMFVGIEPWGPG